MEEIARYEYAYYCRNGKQLDECSNGKTAKSTQGMRAWSSNGKNAKADVDEAIRSTANSIAEHLKQIGAKRKLIMKYRKMKTVCFVGI